MPVKRLTFNLPPLKVTARSTSGEVRRYCIYRGCSARRLMERGESNDEINNVQRSSRRRAARELLQRSPVIRKRPRTQWHKFLKQYAETEDGIEANAVSRSHFVKMAGHSYRNLTNAERKVLADQISVDDAGIMTPVEVEGQVRRITKKIKSQFEELEYLGYKGFAVACCSGEIGTNNLVGTESIVTSFSPEMCEYLRSVITAADPPGLNSTAHPSNSSNSGTDVPSTSSSPSATSPAPSSTSAQASESGPCTSPPASPTSPPASPPSSNM